MGSGSCIIEKEEIAEEDAVGEEQIVFLGEDDFLPGMEGTNKAWREQSVVSGDLRTSDGLSLRYYYAIPESPKAAVTIIHGFCEFFIKYHELAWYLYRSGFAFFFLEQRGHGYSEGKLKEADVVYIDRYETYLSDQKSFLDQVVFPKTEGLKKLLFAHSMGGAVGTLLLEAFPQYFEAAVLSSPMLRMKAGHYPPPAVAMMRLYMRLTGKSNQIAPGQHHFSGVPSFETSSSLSKARYEYQFNARLADPHYQMYGASFSWAAASLTATHQLLKKSGLIRIPVTLLTAGDDHLIDPEGYRIFLEKVSQTKRIHYETARHELFNADDENRRKYFSDLLEALNGYCAG